MAPPRNFLYYWDTTEEHWVQALTSNGANAVVGLLIEDTLGNPREAEITIVNRPPKRNSNTASDRIGPFTNKFTLFTPIVLRDGETKQITFTGHVYKEDKKYNYQHGDVINIKAFDALEESRNYPISMLGIADSDEDGRAVIPLVTSGAENLLTNSKQRQIRYIIDGSATGQNGIKSRILDMVDISPSTDADDQGRTNANKSVVAITKYTPVEKRRGNSLQLIAELANEDRHSTVNEDNIGYDYYAAPYFLEPRSTLTMTLDEALDNSELPIDVNSSTGFIVGDIIKIDDEKMKISAIDSSTLITVAARGHGGTTAATHTNGATITKLWRLPNGSTHKQAFNYFKRGSRPSFGGLIPTNSLNIISPSAELSESGARPLSGGSVTAKRIMLPSNDWTDPSEQLYSHAVVNYDARHSLGPEAAGGEDTYGATLDQKRSKQFELLYVYDLKLGGVGNDVDFIYKGLKLDSKENISVAGTGSAELLDLYNTDGSSKTADDVCRIQFRSILPTSGGTGEYTQNGIEYVLISDVDESKFPTSGVVMFKGAGSGASFLFNASTELAASWQGRPFNAWKVKRPMHFNYTTNPSDPDELRNNIANRLRRVTKDIRRGQFQTIRGPYFWVEGQVEAVSQTADVLTGLKLRNHDENNDIIPHQWGIRPGMTIRFFGTDSTYRTETAHGQITAVSAADVNLLSVKLSDNTTVVADPDVDSGGNTGHYFRVYIPLRAGDGVKVQNRASGIDGNHLILKTLYSEGPARVDCTWSTIGENNTVTLAGVPGIEAGALKGVIDNVRTDGTLLPEISIGQQTFSFVPGAHVSATAMFSAKTGALTTTLKWTGGTLQLGNGSSFSIAAGETTAMNSDGRIYNIWFDRGVSDSTFQTNTEANFSASNKRVLVAWAKYGTPQVEFGIVGGGSTGQANQQVKQDAAVSIVADSIASSLTKRGAQGFTSNMKIRPHDTPAFNKCQWDSFTISFNDGTTLTVNAGTADSNDLDSAAGSRTSMWMGVAVPGSGNGTLVFTTTYANVSTDAVINVGVIIMADENEVESPDTSMPTVFPVNAKEPVIAAGLITANTLSAITANVGTLTAGTIQGVTIRTLANNTSGIVLHNDTLKIYGTDDAGSGTTGRLQWYDSADGERFRIRGTTQRNYNLLTDVLGSSWAMRFVPKSGEAVSSDTPLGIYPQQAVHLGMVTHNQQFPKSTTTSSTTYGWSSLILETGDRHVQISHGGSTSYKIRLPITEPAAGKILKVVDPVTAYDTSGVDALLEWADVGSGNLPTGGASNQILEYGGSSGTAAWTNFPGIISPTLGTTGENGYPLITVANGTSTPVWAKFTNNTFQIQEEAGTGTGMNYVMRSMGAAGAPRLWLQGNASNNGQYGPQLKLSRSKSSSSLTGTTTLADNDDLGAINFYGYTTNGGNVLMGQITTIQAGSSPSGNNVPGSRLYIRASKTSTGVASGVPGTYQLTLDEGYGVGVHTVASSNYSGYYSFVVANGNSGSNYVGLGGDSNGYAAYVTGNGYVTGTWTVASDERIKDNVATITGADALTKLNALNPVAFDWAAKYIAANPAKQATSSAGFLASEFGTVFPHAVQTSDVDLVKKGDEYRIDSSLQEGESIDVENLKGIDPNIVIPYLVAAIKDLEARLRIVEG